MRTFVGLEYLGDARPDDANATKKAGVICRSDAGPLPLRGTRRWHRFLCLFVADFFDVAIGNSEPRLAMSTVLTKE